MLRKHLGIADGFVLYTTSVLGLGLIVLPSIAARQAGPWSIFVWAALAGVSFPMARVMAELSRRFPSAGGVTAFIAHGLGRRAGQLTGVLYLTAILVGAPITALFFSEYVGTLVFLPPDLRAPVAGAFLATLVAVNLCDVSLTMRAQRYTFYCLICVVAAGILISLSHIDATRLSDTSGFGIQATLNTALICFFAFVGWENAAFSGEEFHDPDTLVKALRASVLCVGLLFTAISIAIVGVLDRSTLATSNASLSDLLNVSLGVYAQRASAAMALVIIVLMMMSWVRGASRLLYALAREGVFPAFLAVVDSSTHSPHRALIVLGAAWGLSLTVFAVLNLRVEHFLRLASANFLATYIMIFIAAWRLLAGTRLLALLLISTLALAVLVIGGYRDLWYSAAVIAAFAVFVTVSSAAAKRRIGDGR